MMIRNLGFIKAFKVQSLFHNIDNHNMDELKEKFFRAYSDVPISLRKEIIVVIKGKTLTWDTAYFEVKNNTKLAKIILNTLKDTGII